MMKYTLTIKHFFLGLIACAITICNINLHAASTPEQPPSDDLAIINEDELIAVLATDPNAIDTSLNKLNELEKKMPMTWSEKMRILVSFLSLEAKHAKNKISKWAQSGKEKLNKAQLAVYEHAKEHEQLYVISSTCVVLAAIALWYACHAHLSQT
jgi:hypothetical protein